jgi:glyoxylase I family protein
MPSGDINHIRITVNSLSESAAFYAQLLSALGYRIAHQSGEKISFHHRHSQLAFILSQASEPLDQYHSCNGPGLHHLAFHASCKEDVDRVFLDVLSRSKQIRILHSPCECPEYSPGYYAVFFEDPNGIKLEIAFTPNHFHEGAQ